MAAMILIIVVYSKDIAGIGMAHNIKSPESQPYFFQMTIRQDWLVITKPEQADWPETPSKCHYGILKKIIVRNFIVLTN